MGTSSSKLEKVLGESFPESERYFGLENFGNTCYCNSVLQSLYFCTPFRTRLMEQYEQYSQGLAQGGETSAAEDGENLLVCLGELFAEISNHKKKTGVIAPKRFISCLKKENELFRSYMHQDAQEFLYFLLNNLVEILQKEAKAKAKQQQQQQRMVDASGAYINGDSSHGGNGSGSGNGNGIMSLGDVADSLGSSNSNLNSHGNGGANGNGNGTAISSGNGLHLSQRSTGSVGSDGVLSVSSTRGDAGGAVERSGGDGAELKTWVHEIFEGVLTNETRCLCCESVTARDETFLDLSIDVGPNMSITSCLKNFSSTETLNNNDKFFCDTCCNLQEATKRMRVKKPPQVLALHLKRFKYIEELGRHKKLSYRVAFPLELKLCNTVDDAPDTAYSLFSVVVHLGSGPNHGHYVSLVKSHELWLLFDDDNVEVNDEGILQTFFGSTQEFSNNTDNGYILFYEAVSAT